MREWSAITLGDSQDTNMICYFMFIALNLIMHHQGGCCGHNGVGKNGKIDVYGVEVGAEM